MIEDIFKTLGFSEAEANIYILLSKHGASTGGEIAKYAACPRPTAYKHLEKLVQTGLAAKSTNKKTTLFSAESPEKIRLLYNQKLQNLSAKKDNVEALVLQLLAKQDISTNRPKITYYEGKNEVETALLDLFLFQNITIHSFWSALSALSAVSDDFFWHFNQERIKHNIQIQGIWPDNHNVNLRKHPFQGSHPALKRNIRIAPKGFDTQMSCRIYANKVLYFSSDVENFCFIIESHEHTNMLLNMHKLVWSLSAPYQSKAQEIQHFIDDL